MVQYIKVFSYDRKLKVNKMRIAICDDEFQCRQQTVQAIDECMRNIDILADVFENGRDFLQAFQKNPYDLVFLDIEMPETDGISLARKLRSLSCDVPIVFLTSHIEYALEGYEVNALRYLTKPIQCEKLNNLLCMNEMLRLGRTEDATEYLQGLIDTADTLSAKYVSGDEILDCILAAKASDMERKSIVFKLDGVLAGGLSWKPIDVCNVFANALDNAIEACENMPTEQRIITMKLKATPQFWFIRIQNPVAKHVDVSRLFQEKSGYTSKSNSLQHGIGTYNMKRTVERYGGIVKAECKDNQFILEFMIDKSSFD